MAEVDRSVDKLLASLQERAKELNCLYEVENALNQPDLDMEEAFKTVVDAIPPGWQYPDVCRASIEYKGKRYESDDYEASQWQQSAEISVQDHVVGRITVCYVEERPREAMGPFLKEEDRLIRTIADRIAHCVLYQQLKEIRQNWQEASSEPEPEKPDKWRGPVELLRRSDRDLYLRIARKMLNHLCWTGVDGAQPLLQATYGSNSETDRSTSEVNFPEKTGGYDLSPLLTGKPFTLASTHLSDEEILDLVQDWITEDKASFLPKVLHSPRATLHEIGEALQRFHHLLADGAELSQATQNGIRVLLIRRFLTEQLEFITVAKEHLDSSDFLQLLDRVILSAANHGKLGGKSAGLFLAEKILTKSEDPDNPVAQFKVPRSWYLPSEGLMRFIEHNDLEEVLQLKYKEIAQARQEYPNIIQLFKSSRMPSDIVKALLLVLEEAGDVPLVVRSSSLLEDRIGSAFSGKYKSLFLANRGSRPERLAALTGAIEEIYASVFGPDPIAYRRERGLLDFHEEMGILIQEVVGKKVGRYFLPAAAGVAFSNNEFRWSPRIQREDGLIRMVPGLGTRAVDRLTDDYPILAVPGQPNLRVNASVDEVIRYSPTKLDLIDLEA
ncbi:MAG: pyruvate, phosphate dikinase, partial [bacterium]|nr:pyruvate, phosphate dikinase [bacterium]